MTDYTREGVTTFDVRAETFVAVPPDKVYDTVSDLARSAEWSVECRGGTWVRGVPREVGSVFRGDNERSAEPVAWAPVVRGSWRTEAEVVEAVPGKVFRWVVLDSARKRQESTWSFEIEAVAGGSLLTHHYRLGRLTEGLAKIFSAGLDEGGRERFVREWNAKLAADVRATVEHLKYVLEKG
ncbi:SRPBCC family protein [Streptomyces silvensis]|uniref:Polyketide cyclase n=1 Tax=Streptomyces silvensis TaxID=1765722 RepID=A0A0W7XCS7_9ACTN|nr:SRPBCC family protein [Streptomyces silvensis]KUF20452.1 polyketide cyclase [Streptomyces silvensis]